tara:strand:- start:3865 stop:4056 length:192 start_codon:yes stop_codon:yes gene_type:complete
MYDCGLIVSDKQRRMIGFDSIFERLHECHHEQSHETFGSQWQLEQNEELEIGDFILHCPKIHV